MRLSILRVIVVASIVIWMMSPIVYAAPEDPFTLSATGISLSIDFNNGTIQEFQGLEGNDVYEVTNKSTSVEADWFGDLVYVYSISGVSDRNGNDLYWQYWVNGNRPSLAANKYILQDGDSVQWKLSSQSTETTTSPMTDVDYSLIFGVGILGVVMVSVLVALWLNNREVKL